MKVLIYVFILTVSTINSFTQTITWEHTGGPAGGYVHDLVKDANDNFFAGTTRGVFRSMQSVLVELLSFTATVSGASVKLKGQTTTEINNKGIDIERKESCLPNEWEKIGYVVGSGTTTEPGSYSFKDNYISPGEWLYRLKHIDFDGTFEYSPKAEVTISLQEEFMLKQNYPNPFNPPTKIKYTIPQKEYFTLKIYNLASKKVTVLVNEEKTPEEIKLISSRVIFQAEFTFISLLQETTHEQEK